MSDEQQPRAEWIFPEEKKSNKKRIWLIVGLSVVTITIVGALLFFLLPRDGESAPAPSLSPTSPSPSPTSSSRPSLAPTSPPIGESAPAPSETTTPPVEVSPGQAEFRDRVMPRLNTAITGLDMMSSGTDPSEVMDVLQQDAMNLADESAPESIASAWNSRFSDYLDSLNLLVESVNAGTDTSEAIENIRSDVLELQGLASS